VWLDAQRVTRLPNGLAIVTARAPQMASISLGLWVGSGGRHEPAAWNGAAHFLEHMLFKGTGRRSPREISQAVEGIGGYLDAFTSEEHTCFYAKALSDHLPRLLDVLMDMLLHPRLASRDINLEREVIKEEVALAFDDPQQHVQELINETFWPDHPLGRPLAGTPQSLDRLRRPQLVRFKRRHYVASNLVIAAAGDLCHDEVARAAGRYARRLPAGSPPDFEPLVSTQAAPRLRLSTRNISQAQMMLGFRTCSRHDERRFGLRLLNAVLGENMSSRLFQELREDRGLAYHVQSTVSFFHDAGTLDISVGLDPENLPRVLRLILRLLRRLADHPLDRAELGRARDYALGQMALSLENTENQMTLLGEQWLGFGRLISVERIRRRLAAVTASELQRAARDFFRPERLNLALVGPLKSAPRLERMLSRQARLLG
jgi:predicted Zn-dependent peptidase